MAVLTPIRRPALSRSGPPELPGINGGIGLDNIVDGAAGNGGDLPAKRTDNPGGQGLVKSEGIADGKDLLPNQQILGFTEDDGAQLIGRGADLQDRQIPVRGRADQHRLPGGAIGQGNLQAAGVGNDMVIGDDPALLIPDKP